MKTANVRLRVTVAAICSVVAMQVNADTVRYYGEGHIPDPQVVAKILGGTAPSHGFKMRGSSSWAAPAAEVTANDGGRNLSDDASALREDRINTAAQAALEDWRQRQPGAGKHTLALAESSNHSPALAESKPAAQRTPAQPDALAVAITFANDSARIPPSAEKSLAAVAEGMRIAGFSKKFVIEGHTSATGSLGHNMRLSRLRAESVKRYFVTQYGIPAAALRAVGMGPKSPLNKQNPYAAENRRVQFRVAA